MGAKFNYNIQSDTLNGTIDLEKLNRDLYRLNLNEELITIFPSGNNLLFEFQEPLNDVDTLDQALDNLVSNHDGLPLAEPRICELLGEGHAHGDFTVVNYKIETKTNLFPKRIFAKGELQKVEWYKESDFQTLVLMAEMEYSRDPFGFATSRTTTRTWFDTDGEPLDEIKTTTKNYSNLETIKEGKRRRGNIVDGIQLPVMGLMVETMTIEPWNLDQQTILLMGRDFMDRFELEFSKFIDNSSTITSGPNIGKKSIVVALEDASATTDTWLLNKPASIGGQIRILDYLTSEFSI